MKFVCSTGEPYMNFEKVETPGQDTLGVFFGCPSCKCQVLYGDESRRNPDGQFSRGEAGWAYRCGRAF